MRYIKHAGKFYKEIKLDDLSKDDLIDLIKNAVEVNNTTYPIYVDRWVKTYPWINTYVSSAKDNALTLDYQALKNESQSHLASFADGLYSNDIQ